MTNSRSDRGIDKQPNSGPKGRPGAQTHSDINDPTKAPGMGISSPAKDQREDIPQSETARDLAEDTIDRLTDDRASDAEKEHRKRELLDGPTELRKARRDVEK